MAADPQPTGTVIGDVLVTVGLTTAVVLAASIASSWAWVLATGIVAVFVEDDLLAVAAVLVVLVVAASNFETQHRRAVGALVGAGVVQLALRLSDQSAVGTSALLATAAFAPLLVGGWALARSGTRVWVRRIATGAAAVWVGGALLLAVATVAARTDAQRAVDQAEAGLAAARRGDTEAAADLLASAERSFAAARSSVGAWWAWPARLVPGVGLQAEALARATRVGELVADAGADSAGSADLADVRLVRGRVDLDAVAQLAGPVRRLDDALEVATDELGPDESPWLLSPIADRLERLRVEIARAAEDAALAASGIEALPPLLGGERTVHYVVLFGTASESRPLGGFVGAFAEIVFDDGEMTLVRHGNVDDLNEAGRGRELTNPGVLPDRYLSRRPDRFWQQIGATPDLPTAAEATRQMWPQSGGGALDGVIYVDSAGVAALLELTGPVEVGDPGRRLVADTADEFFLRDLYDVFPDSDERDGFVEDSLVAVVDALAERDLPGPEQLGEALGPAAARGHLAIYSFDDVAAPFLHDLGIDGALPAVGPGDFLSVRWDNFSPNKADAYLARDIEYDVSYDPGTGHVESVARITFENDVPLTGVPFEVNGNVFGRPIGTNIAQVGVHSPLRLVGATIDGSPAPTSTNEEYGRFLYGLEVEFPPGEAVVVELRFEGDLEPSPTYHLRVSEPAAALPATLQFTVAAADGWEDGAGRSSVVGEPFRPDSSDDVAVRFSTT